MKEPICQLNQNILSEDEKIFYEKHNPGFRCTGDVLIYGHDYLLSSYIVFEGNCTPQGTARDCGDHFIIAEEQYIRIDKDTMKVTYNANDI